MENETVNSSSRTPNGDDVYDDNDVSGFQINITAYIVSINIITGFGLIGNFFIIAIMTSKTMRSHSYAVYMTLLAISDSCVLIEIAFEDNLDHVFHLLNPIMNAHIAVCNTVVFLQQTVTLLSPWVLVAMTFDRYIVIVFPLHKTRLCTRRYALIACAVLCLFSIASTSPYPFYLTYIEQDGITICMVTNLVIDYYRITVSSLLQSFLPVVILSLLNIHTAVVLRRTVKSTMRRTESGASLNQTKLIKITISLILVSSLSLVSLIPFTVAESMEFILQLLGDQGSELFSRLWMVFNVVRLLNYSMNFYVLVSFSDQYRQIVIRMLKKPCSKTDNTRSVYSVTESSNVM